MFQLLRRLWPGEDTVKTSLTAALFSHAAEAWLESRRPYLGGKAYTRYQFYLRPLKAFFAEQRLGEITADMIRAYQRARAATVEASTINHECSLLQQMLKRIERWREISYDYQPLPLPKTDCGRALTDTEYTRLFGVAGSSRHFRGVMLFALISVLTTASPGEVKALHLSDINLEEGYLDIGPEAAKNPERQRRIWLGDPTQLEAVKAALARAKKMGAREAQHYLFPGGSKGKVNPNKPQGSFKTAWKSLCQEAEIENFRIQDLRHTAISRLLRDPRVPPTVAQRMAGHISLKMQKRYGHIDADSMRKAAAALAPPWKKKAAKPA